MGASIEEEKRQILGRKTAEKANQTKRGRENPQKCGGTGCEIPQEADAETCSSPCGISQGGRVRKPASRDAKSRRGRVQNSASPDLAFEVAVDLAVDSAVDLSEKLSLEHSCAAAVENLYQEPKSENLPRIQEQYRRVWQHLLDSLIWTIGEKVYLHLCVNTKLARAQKIADVVEVDVSLPDAAYEALLIRHQTEINKALRAMGFGRDEIRIQFVGPSVPQEVA